MQTGLTIMTAVLASLGGLFILWVLFRTNTEEESWEPIYGSIAKGRRVGAMRDGWYGNSRAKLSSSSASLCEPSIVLRTETLGQRHRKSALWETRPLWWVWRKTHDVAVCAWSLKDLERSDRGKAGDKREPSSTGTVPFQYYNSTNTVPALLYCPDLMISTV